MRMMLMALMCMPMFQCSTAHAEIDLPTGLVKHLTPVIDLVLTDKQCAESSVYGKTANLRFNTTGKVVSGCWQQYGDNLAVALVIDKQIVNLHYKVHQFTPITYF